MLIGLISDTHGYLNPRVFHIFADVDHILHAGDVGDENVLIELQTIAPVNAVAGNVDSYSVKLPGTYCGDFGSLRICMTHGHRLDPANYNASAVEMFAKQKPQIIIHGHSHRAKNEVFGEVAIINPGAACKPRFRDMPSVAVLDIAPDGTWVCRFEALKA